MEKLLFPTYPLFEAFKILNRYNPQIDSIKKVFALSNQGRLQLNLFLNTQSAILTKDKLFRIELGAKLERDKMILSVTDEYSLVDSETNGEIEFSSELLYVENISLDIKKFNFYTDENNSKRIILREMQVEYKNELFFIHAVGYGQIFITKDNIKSFIGSKNNIHSEEPIPVKGRPSTLLHWVEWKVRREGLAADNSIKYGFQTKLVNEAYERFGYSESSIKTTWRKAGLTKK